VPKHELVLDTGEYAPVADRITLFYARYPTGRILTRLISRTRYEITVQAFIFRSVSELRPSATGLASERIGDGDVNTVACLENTETSAIGRALANLGLTASAHRPSREEIDKANRERARRVSEATPSPRPPVVPRGASTSPAAKPTPRPPSLTSRAPAVSATGGNSMQRRADRVMDALDLLDQAERAGLPHKRARRLRDTLTEPTASVVTIERVERMIRAWTASRHATHLRL
jgi:hypothetical protein